MDYRTLLVFDNCELQDEIQKLHVWGMVSEFEITDTARDGLEAYGKMKQNHYDLVITEIRITGMDGLTLLRHIKREGLCAHVVLCSEFPDFDYARQGIILGAYDYLVKPFKENELIQLFNRIKNETYSSAAVEIYYTEELISCMKQHSTQFFECVDSMMKKFYEGNIDLLTADKIVMQIYKTVIEKIYELYEWMGLYKRQEDFFVLDGIQEGKAESYMQLFRKKLYQLYDIFCELYPTSGNEQIEEIIQYILNHPENDLKQKSIAVKMHINSSFLSTVFGAYTDIHFVNYIMNVKLRRAAYLLAHSSFKVVEIAERLQYKDTAYFSRIFKKKFSMTPSEYKSRFEINDYQI